MTPALETMVEPLDAPITPSLRRWATVARNGVGLQTDTVPRKTSVQPLERPLRTERGPRLSPTPRVLPVMVMARVTATATVVTQPRRHKAAMIDAPTPRTAVWSWPIHGASAGGVASSRASHESKASKALAVRATSTTADTPLARRSTIGPTLWRSLVALKSGGAKRRRATPIPVAAYTHQAILKPPRHL